MKRLTRNWSQWEITLAKGYAAILAAPSVILAIMFLERAIAK